MTQTCSSSQRVQEPSAENAELLPEVLAGLSSEPKRLPPKLFYDERGARLFEEICEQPEYYPTRTEIGILRLRAPDIARHAGPRAALIEYGSGAGVKARLLLDALEEPTAYLPVDISSEQLEQTAHSVRELYPDLTVLPVNADYTSRFSLPPLPDHARRVAFYPGSTIGNFHPTEATAFLRRVRSVIQPGGALVLGVDRRKDEGILNDAYNDATGVTAEFNLNMLRRLNRDLGASFDLGRFRHRAFYDIERGRIEMHLESTVEQDVSVGGAMIHFEAGETIHSESSYKYDRDGLEALVEGAGLRVEELWSDEREWFSVAYLVAA